MSRYKFRLETVQKVRRVRRDQSRAALADAFRAEQTLADNRAAVAAELAELRELQRAAATGRHFDINVLVEAQQYDLVLRSQQQELARQQSLLAIETERRRLAAVEADRDVRVLELLDERHRREHQRDEARREAKQLDEVAASLPWRGGRSES